MKNKIKITSWFAILTMFTVLLPILGSVENYQAATSYTNAKEFFESTALNGEDYHAEMINGTIYYATSAKLASSSSNLRYHTVGFDITLSGNGHSVAFAVQRTGGSMVEIDSRKDSRYEYILYAVKDKTLHELASKSNPIEASYVLSASTINVKMNAILVTKQGSSLGGGITEDGSGGFTKWGTIYRLKDSSDLNALKSIFTGHDFKSYININEKLANHQLQLRYQAQGLNSTSSTTATVRGGFSVKDGFLSQNGSTYIQKQRVLQQMNLLDPYNIGLQKEGYHLVPGREWMTKESRVFNSGDTYMPQTIEPLVGSQDKGITMYANWQANTYSVNYDANGGTGAVLPTDFSYDQMKKLSDNTFTRTGYKLRAGAEWNTRPDGTGTSYATGESVSNLTSENGGTVTLYANWEPEVYTITFDQQNGTGGTSVIYEKYGAGFYSDAACTKAITAVTNPSKTAHLFQGYYAGVLGAGMQIVNQQGTLLIESTYYTSDETIYAHYIPNEYTITFDKQGGKLGTDSIKVYAGDYFPSANGPVRTGYTFKGYYTQTNGGGTQYYNENMASGKIFNFTSNLTLYAYWADDTAPTVVLKTSADKWTNQKITLTADASDYGRGLKSVYIYHVADNGALTLVAQNASCNGAASTTLSYVNPTEGIIRYKAVATDLAGNTAESYNTAYYDITPPKGEVLNRSVSGTTAFFKVNITDVNVK